MNAEGTTIGGTDRRGEVLIARAVFDGRRWRGPGCVGVRDGRVVAIGRPDDVERVGEAVGPGARRTDLGDSLVAPGFVDAHMHPLVGGLERLRCELNTVDPHHDAYARVIGEHLAGPGATEPDRWVRGGGWSAGAYGAHGPTAAALDRVVADRPAYLVASDHHNAWVNTRALEIAGIDASTPDPPDGWIERDSEGRPTGTLHEAAMALVDPHLDTTRAEYADAMREAQRHLHGWGLAGWHDALIGGYAGLDDPTRAYLDLIEAGELTARVTASQWWDRHRGTEQVEELVAQRDRLAEQGLVAGSVKIMMDGIAETLTATVERPYAGSVACPCGDRGLAFLDADQVREAVVALDRAGLAVHVHAIGDRAVHDALDAIEAARRGGLNRLPHQIAHLQLVRPADRTRFADLQVIANLQGMWVRSDDASVSMLAPHLDAERFGWHYPFGDIAAAGAELAGGSDWPVNPPEPIAAIHALVNRCAPAHHRQADPLVVDQALDLRAAFAAYTSGSARAGGLDDVGVIRVGARADLVVLDRDPFAGPTDRIGEAQIVATYADGVRVHGD